MATPIWFAKILKAFFPYRKPIARISKLPGIARAVDQIMFQGDRLIYVPKDRVAVGEAIDQPGGTVLPSSLVDYFIEKASYHWIMDHCLCREGDNCQSFPHDIGCIFLGEAVTRINPGLGRMVSRAEALEHARRARQMGLVQLIGRDRLDSIWLGAGPSHKLMTICSCCPCCCLFRILPDLDPWLAQRVSRMPGVTLWVDDTCSGCGKCTRSTCFVDAIQLVNGKAVISEACRGCGRCVEVCPQSAIHLTIEDSGYVQRAIAHISPLIDVDGAQNGAQNGAHHGAYEDAHVEPKEGVGDRMQDARKNGLNDGNQ